MAPFIRTTIRSRRAGHLAEPYALQAYDAVHLASLEQIGDSEVALVSAGDELVEAARSLGFTTIRPLG
ncbi:MAG: hypothetical protein ICV64_10155 [Thermoleophilia bacterium]|nr:hypothetical protein [Thermoleophilia bacterium]